MPIYGNFLFLCYPKLIIIPPLRQVLLQHFTHAVPEGVLAPTLSAISSTEVQIDWSTPQSPNGIIVVYNLYRITGDEETLETFFSEVSSYVVGGLEPFTEYMFLVEACTTVGCNRSAVASVVTLESG